tara:strand:+ start:76167 stop:76391 length:225 start_codon:yes stop_codon:yes gene_type:complete
MDTAEINLSLDLTVKYKKYPACKGARENGTGLQLEPDEEAFIEIESIYLGKQIISELSKEDIEQIEEEIACLED